jgi:hypothetical protein
MVGALPRPRYCFAGPPRMAGLQRSDVQHVLEHEDLSDRHVCCSDRGIFECLPKQQPSVTVAAVRCGVWSTDARVHLSTVHEPMHAMPSSARESIIDRVLLQGCRASICMYNPRSQPELHIEFRKASSGIRLLHRPRLLHCLKLPLQRCPLVMCRRINSRMLSLDGR